MGKCGTLHAIINSLPVIALLILAEALVSNGFAVNAGLSRPSSNRRQRPCNKSLLRASKAGWDHSSSTIVKTETPAVKLSVPVFSLATVNEDGSTNMNIVTYASPVGIEPEPLWMVSLYKGTLSHENFFREGWGVLQLLRRKHVSLVSILGKNSGRDTDKADACGREAFPWEQPSREILSAPRDVSVIPDCGTYITLHMVSKQPAGDHDAVVCRFSGVAGPGEGPSGLSGAAANALETRHLREAGII